MSAFDLLICPLCQPQVQRLSLSSPKSLRCAAGHCFDISKRGYVNLLPVQQKRSKDPGDSDAMVKARFRFLNTGAYSSIAEFINQYLAQLMAEAKLQPNFNLLDAGCGDGYYLDYMAQQFEQANLYGLDISKPAIDQASRRNKSINCLVASNRQAPLLAQSFDVIVCAFGFPCYEDFAQLLKPGGKLLLLESSQAHLLELRQRLYPQIKQKPLPAIDTAFEQGFSLQEQRFHQANISLDPQQLADLLCMTPHGYRASSKAKAEVLALPQLDLGIDLSLRVLTRNA